MKKIVFFLLFIIAVSVIPAHTHASEVTVRGIYTEIMFENEPIEGNPWVVIIRVNTNISGWEIWFGPQIVAGPAEDKHYSGDVFQVEIDAEFLTAGKKEVRVLIHPSRKTTPTDLLFLKIYVQHVLTDTEKILSLSSLFVVAAMVVVIRRDYMKFQEKQWTIISWKLYVLNRSKFVLPVFLVVLLFWLLSIVGVLNPLYDWLKTIGIWRW